MPAFTSQLFSLSVSYLVTKRNPQAHRWATDNIRNISCVNLVIMGNLAEI